ncbi:MAG: RND family transporter [Desulfuromonadales bacterium]|nr:RND family transporter [Desulfuromonadales bacterium]
MKHSDPNNQDPVARYPENLDTDSGSLVERILFKNRLVFLILSLLLTIFLGWQATNLRLNASYEKTIPTKHPYVAAYQEHKADLSGLGNAIRIAVENPKGTIFDAEYMKTLSQINDEVFLLPGVDRPYMKSLWTPATRWVAVTEEGLEGDVVVGDFYDGSPESMLQLRANVERSGEIGRLIAPDFKSSIIYVPLLDVNLKTGEPLDYDELSKSLEQLRAKYESDRIQIHITGFAKIVGDLIAGLTPVFMFFAIAFCISAVILYFYTRSVRSTFIVVLCSLVAVVWQLGLLGLFGYELDPYSILVPFLVFAIGMSHGTQIMNGIIQDIGRGAHKLVAARLTFRRLFRPGLTAVISDAVGFAVLMVIQIQVIQELAVAASSGEAVLIFTNLILIPLILSYAGVSSTAAERAVRSESNGAEDHSDHPVWRFLDLFTQRRWATGAILVAVVLAVIGLGIRTQLRIGDLDPGAPELRADSRYNQDNAYMVQHYASSSDIFVVMVETPEFRCTDYATLYKVDELAWQLEQLPGVEATNSMAALAKFISVGYNEGNFKWLELIPNQGALGGVQTRAPREMFNQSGDLLTLYVYLKDHKADTLNRVVEHVSVFAQNNDTADVRFRMAAGSAGIDAATNIVVEKSNRIMVLLIYAAVILLCFVTFRSWRAVLCAVLPLMLTSILCEALMVGLGIGVKVATLPVIALGVGIGVDYALYVLSVILVKMRQGKALDEAYYEALRSTGKVVVLIGLTLALGVATWVASPIKFQADMGILLAFMFLLNMLGALILLPALARFLLPKPILANTVVEECAKECDVKLCA